MTNIYLITQGLIEKSDSIGYDLAFQYRLFRQWGMSVRVFTGQYKQSLYPDIPIENIDRLSVVMEEQPGLIVYHWVDGWKEIDEWIGTLSSPVVIRWHNNTPPWFFAPYSIDSAARTTRGFMSIVKMIGIDNVKFWVNSEFTKRQLEILGASSDRINVIYPASHYIEHEDIEHDHEHEHKNIGYNSTNIIDNRNIMSNGTIRLLFVGRITPHKGYHHVMLTAYILQKWLGKKVDIYFPGRPDNSMSKYLQQLHTLSNDLRLSTHFLGEIGLQELYNLYRTSHAFVALSEHEGFGLPIIEAMRMKLPVVGYRSTAVANLLYNHPLACDQLDYFDIARKLAVIIQSDSARSAILKLQSDVILPQFSKKVIEDQLSRTLGRGHIDTLTEQTVDNSSVDNSNVENASIENSSLEIINNTLNELAKIPMPIVSLPFSYKDYPNHYMTHYDILSYNNLLNGQGKSPEETDLWDEAMQIKFNSHRTVLGPLIIRIKKMILYLQDGMIKTVVKANARTDKKLSLLDNKLERLIKEHTKLPDDIRDDSMVINSVSSMYDSNYFEGKKIKSNYDSYSRDAHIPGKVLARTLWELFRPKSFLDVGCALGFVVKAMREYNVDARGVDISEWAVREANIPHINQLDISRQKIVGKYDIVTAFDILEHIPERLLPYAVKNLWQATDHYLIAVPAYYEEGTSYDSGDPLHVVFHPKSWWEDLFRSCGMSTDTDIAEKLGQTEYAKTYGYAGRFIVGVRK